MFTVPARPDPAGGRVRIAISSPEILAHIRQEFARKGLDVQIDGPPMVDVVVTPTAGARPPAPAGPHVRRRDPATARYRLALIPHDNRAQEGSRAPACRSLSPREAQVMDSISRGMRNPDIAALLQVRQKTVKNHVNRIFTKLGARTRVEAVLIWQSETSH